MNDKDMPDKLLSNYRLWGIAAISSFVIFIILLLLIVFLQEIRIISIFAVLLFGFIWIGTTSISRHSFILLKNYIGKEVSVIEFLSTQLVVFLFPLAYRKVKEEVEAYRKEKGVKQDLLETKFD